MTHELDLRCERGCVATLVSIAGELPDDDQVFDLALDFVCPYCGGELVVFRRGPEHA